MYGLLNSTAYEGEWGETLGDFFNPEDGTDYGADADNFLPFAAVLSEGQLAGIEFLSLYSLIQIGAGTEEAAKETLPDVQEIFKDAESISIYSGINRAIFRGGVALTSQAKMQENMGRDPYGKLWDLGGLMDICSYAAFSAGTLTLTVGIALTKMTSATPFHQTITLQSPIEYEDVLVDMRTTANGFNQVEQASATQIEEASARESMKFE